MALAPAVAGLGGGFAVTHTGDPVTIIDYANYVSIMEWAATQSSAFGLSPILTFPPLGTGVVQAYGAGTTDDSLAINAATLALKGTGMGLYFPPGTYLVSANAFVNNGVPFLMAQGATFSGTNAASFGAQATYVPNGASTNVTIAATGNTALPAAAAPYGTIVINAVTLTAAATLTLPANPGQTWIIDPRAVTLGAFTLGLIANGNTWGTTLAVANLYRVTYYGPAGKLFGNTLTP